MRICTNCREVCGEWRLLACPRCHLPFGQEPAITQSGIRNTAFKWVAKNLAYVSVFTLVVLWNDLAEVKKSVLNTVTASIAQRVNRQFSDSALRELVITQASKDVQSLYRAELQPRLSEIESKAKEQYASLSSTAARMERVSATKLDSFEKSVDGLSVKVANVDSMAESAKAELEALRRRREVSDLAVAAISNGDVKAFDRLQVLSGTEDRDLGLLAGASLVQIVQFYELMSRIEAITIEFRSSSGVRQEKDLTLCDLLATVRSNPKWEVRARAARLISKWRNAAALEVLMTAMKSDPHLEVRKEATRAFSRITEHAIKGNSIEVKPILDWHVQNKQSVDLKLTDTQTCVSRNWLAGNPVRLDLPTARR